MDDNETQHKYFQDALKIRGDLQEIGVQINVGIIEVPKQAKSAEEWNEG